MPAVLESPDETVTGVEVDGAPTPPLGGPATAGQDPIFAPAGDDISTLSKGLAPAAREKADADASILGSTAKTVQEDATRAHAAFNAEAATSHDIPSWDEQAQKAKFATDPVKAFGSVGSVFAMVAAAFTHRPMINALQGSAAAMDAIREGNDKNYKDAFAAWKSNTELALKRHDMMHQEYQDATELMKTDLSAGETQLKMAALKYGDSKTVFLLENGMSEDIIKLQESRAKASDAVRNTTHADMDYRFRDKAFSTDPRVASGDPQQVLAAWNQAFGKEAPTAEQSAVKAYIGTTKPPTNAQELEQYNKGLEDLHKKFALAGLRPGSAASASNYMQTRVPELMEEHKDDPNYTISKAQIEANNEWQESQKSATKEGRIEARAKEIKKENPKLDMPKAREQARIESVSGGKNLTKPEMSDRVNGPDLIDSLNDLYTMGDVTGLTTGKLSELAAKYATVNDKAAIWAAAHIKAEAALAAYEGSGKTSVKAMQIALDRLPKVYQSSGFNNKVLADSLQSFTSQLQTALNAQESEGKPLDEETLDKFNKVGIFPQSQAKRDPVQILRKDPASLSIEQLKELRSRARQLTPADRKALDAVAAQREKEWQDAHRPRAAAPALNPAVEATVE